jgi:hypothetical protein
VGLDGAVELRLHDAQLPRQLCGIKIGDGNARRRVLEVVKELLVHDGRRRNGDVSQTFDRADLLDGLLGRRLEGGLSDVLLDRVKELVGE